MPSKPSVCRASYAPARTLVVPCGAPANAAHHSGFFAAADGSTLFEQSWLPRAMPRAKVVLVHGLYDHCSRYAELAEALVENAFSVHGYDLRGHAHSEGVRGDFVLSEHVEDVAMFVRRVARRHDPSAPVVILARGVGAVIGGLFAMSGSAPLAGFVALAPAPRRAHRETLGAKLTAILRPDSCLFEPRLGLVSRDPFVVASHFTDPLIFAGGLTRRAVTEIAEGWRSVRERAPSFTTPLLVLQGGADALSDPKEAGAFYDASGTRDKRMQVYAGLANDLLHEPERKRIVCDVVAWMTAHV